MSQEQTRNPTSDEAVAGTWTGSAGSRYTVVDDYPDTSGADELTHGTTAGTLTFGFTAFSVPAGATSISVSVDYYDYKTGSQSCNFGARLKCGSSYFNASTHNPANGSANRTQRTDTWANNPATSAAWTVDQVNGVGSNALAAFGYNSTDASPTIVTSSIRIRVTYTPAPTENAQTLSGTAATTLSAMLTAGASETLSSTAGESHVSSLTALASETLSAAAAIALSTVLSLSPAMALSASSAFACDAEVIPGGSGNTYEVDCTYDAGAGIAETSIASQSVGLALSVTASDGEASLASQLLGTSLAATAAYTDSALASQNVDAPMNVNSAIQPALTADYAIGQALAAASALLFGAQVVGPPQTYEDSIAFDASAALIVQLADSIEELSTVLVYTAELILDPSGSNGLLTATRSHNVDPNTQPVTILCRLKNADGSQGRLWRVSGQTLEECLELMAERISRSINVEVTS